MRGAARDRMLSAARYEVAMRYAPRISAVMGWAAQSVVPNQATLGGVLHALTSE